MLRWRWWLRLPLSLNSQRKFNFLGKFAREFFKCKFKKFINLLKNLQNTKSTRFNNENFKNKSIVLQIKFKSNSVRK